MIFRIVKDRLPYFEDREKDRERSDAMKTLKTLSNYRIIYIFNWCSKY